MGTYSIKDLEQLSGIKAHTLRIWEQRYDIIFPKRTTTNIRYYDDTDLRHVLNISYLNKNGHKISKIAKMDQAEIENSVMNIAYSNLEYPNQVNALIIAMVSLNEVRFEKIIATNTLQFGFENTMINIVYPFLERIGFLWQTGSINPAHEHFITNLIRQKLIVAIDGHINSDRTAARKYLLFLPEGEMHELGLLFAAYIVKSRKNRLIYLGQSLPIDDLATTVQTYQPDYILAILTSYPVKEEAISYAQQLVQLFPNQKVLLTGYQAVSQKESMPKEVEIFEDIPALINYVSANSEQKLFDLNSSIGQMA